MRMKLSLIALILALLLTVPAVISSTDEEGQAEVEIEDGENEDLPYFGRVVPVSLSEACATSDGQSIPCMPYEKMRFFPGARPFLSGMGSATRGGRDNRDIWLKDVQLTENPGVSGTLGTKYEKSIFTVTVQNNGTQGDVTVKFKAVQHPLEEGDQLYEMPVERKEEKVIPSVGQNQEKTVVFEWVPYASSFFIMNFTAYEVGDAVDDNNHIYLKGWISAWSDTCNSEETSDCTPILGNFHIDDAYPPGLEGHSASKVWCHWNDATHTYGPGNHTLETPRIHLNDFDRRYGIWFSYLFSGELGAMDQHKLLMSWDNQENWIVTGHTDASDNAQTGSDWFHFISGQNAPGIQINYRDVLMNVRYRLCVGENGGLKKGYMFDDFHVLGIENFTTGHNLITSYELKLNDNESADACLDPGENRTFNFTLKNDGDNPIHSISFSSPQKPEIMDVAISPFDRFPTMHPGMEENVTMRVSIPHDAKASDTPLQVQLKLDARAPMPGCVCDRRLSTVLKLNISINRIPGLEVVCDDNNKVFSWSDEDQVFQIVPFIINVTNIGNFKENIRFQIIDKTIDWDITLTSESMKENKIEELPVRNSTIVNLTCSIPSGSITGSYNVSLMVWCESYPSVSSTVTLSLFVEAYHGLELDYSQPHQWPLPVDPNRPSDLERQIEFVIRNTGNGPDTASITVTPEQTSDGSWYSIDSDSQYVGPGGGTNDENTFAVDFDLPKDAEPGYHNFSVMAVSDCDTGIVTDSRNISFLVVKPDLQISADIEIMPYVPVIGETVYFTAKIYNNGTSPAVDFNVSFYVDDTLVDYRNYDSLVHGDGECLKPFEYVFTGRGEYSVHIEMDPDLNVSEMIEYNNAVTETVTVTAPDLHFEEDALIIKDSDGNMLSAEAGNYGLEKDGTYKFIVTVWNRGDAGIKDVEGVLKIYHIGPDDREIIDIEELFTIDRIWNGQPGNATVLWSPVEYGATYYVEIELDPYDELLLAEDVRPHIPSEYLVTDPEPQEEAGFELVVLLGALFIVCYFGYRRKKQGKFLR